MSRLSDNQELLIKSLKEFFSKPENLNKMLPIIKKETNISLRLLDWFVTNYAKKNSVIYTHNDEPFIVYLNYKAQLKAFSKRQFDPFCRTTGKGRTLIPFVYKGKDGVEKTICTTIGQLNFFSWSIQNGILDYVIEHFNEIEKDMNETANDKKQRKSAHKGDSDETKKQKKRDLSISASKNITKHNVRIVVKFD